MYDDALVLTLDPTGAREQAEEPGGFLQVADNIAAAARENETSLAAPTRDSVLDPSAPDLPASLRAWGLDCTLWLRQVSGPDAVVVAARLRRLLHSLESERRARATAQASDEHARNTKAGPWTAYT